MSDENSQESGDHAADLVPRDRLNAKERKWKAAASEWSARETLLTKQIESLTAERDAAVTARDEFKSQFDTLNGELQTAKRTQAFTSAGIGDETLQSAIFSIYNATPEDQRGDDFGSWLSSNAYDNPLVAPHLPARGEGGEPGAEASSKAPPTTTAAATFNANARPPGAPPARKEGRDYLDHIRKQTAGMTHEERRSFIAAEKRRLGLGS